MEIVLVVAIGVGLAFGANAMRSKETRVDIHYAYVKPPSAPIPPQPAGQHPAAAATPAATGDGGAEPGPSSGTNGDGDGGTDGHGDDGDAMHAGDGQPRVPQAAPPKSKHVAHEFQTITADEIAELLGSPDLLTGLTVIVDARDDDHFSGPDGGHIPGALQCFPYEPARFIPQITPHVTNAMKVIVYCNGGSCDDSVMMCRTFRDELMVPEGNLFLYEGGWEDWNERGLPVDKGE